MAPVMASANGRGVRWMPLQMTVRPSRCHTRISRPTATTLVSAARMTNRRLRVGRGIVSDGPRTAVGPTVSVGMRALACDVNVIVCRRKLTERWND